MTRRERKEARLQRRLDWAESRDTKADAAFAAASEATRGIEPGQPILVGHHSERHHRRALERADNAGRRGVEHVDMAERHRSVAAGIAHQLDTSIFSDDPDAVQQLRAKVERLEGERQRMKAVNAWMTKHSGFPRRRCRYEHAWTDEDRERLAAVFKRCGEEMKLTADEARLIVEAARWNGAVGFPPYALSNLGATIRRTQQRLEKLEAEHAQRARVAEVLAAEREQEGNG